MHLKGRSIVVAMAALVAAAGTARLGVWQLDRAAQKAQLQQALDDRRALPLVSEATLARDAAAAALQHHRSIVLQGRWAATQTVYLENRQMRGQPGFYAVTPLLLGDGSAVLVQRGWLPRDRQDRTRITVAPPQSGVVVQVRGRIAPAPARLYEFDAVASGAVRQNLELSSFALETGLMLRPLSVVQEDSPAAPQDGLQRQWPQPAANVHKHYGYAFQWFALSALVIGLYVWFQIIRPARPPRPLPPTPAA